MEEDGVGEVLPAFYLQRVQVSDFQPASFSFPTYGRIWGATRQQYRQHQHRREQTRTSATTTLPPHLARIFANNTSYRLEILVAFPLVPTSSTAGEARDQSKARDSDAFRL